jgi:hypothetical protein
VISLCDKTICSTRSDPLALGAPALVSPDLELNATAIA